MNNNIILQRHAWLIEHVRDFPGLTREEILSDWKRSVYYEDGINTFEKSSFFDDIARIEEVYGIRIKANLSNYGYYLSSYDNNFGHKMQRWLLNIVQFGMLKDKCLGLYDRFLAEDFPSEHGILKPVLQAMGDDKKLLIAYQRYGHKEEVHEICPYCIKTYQHRFYILGRYDSGRFYTFSFDRINDIQVTRKRFKMDEYFIAEEYFKNFFGVYVTTEDSLPSFIIIRAYNDAMYYLRDVPLHHSQEEIYTCKEYSDFRYRLFPTDDFLSWILQQAGRLEVISPSSVRKKIAKSIAFMHSQYTRDATSE